MAGRYAKGVAFENQCQHYFEDLGYKVVRSAGSHGPIDLICGNKDEGIIIVQCRMQGNISKSEATELREWAKDFNNARVLLAYKVGRGKEFKNL